ncbi:MAG: NADH-quinone oxidoreductase subunit N [Archaeoglobaceae archaeon]
MIENFNLVYPEIIVALFAFIAVSITIASKESKTVPALLSLAGVIIAMYYLWQLKDVNANFFTFVFDYYAWVMKLIFLTVALLVILISWSYLKDYKGTVGEYYALLLIATVGMMVVVSARELITLYVAFETASLSSYALTAYFKKNRFSNEAGLKYLFFGAFSSGLILYGLSLVYGLTGTTELTAIGTTLTMDNPLALLALGMMIAGFGYKISAVPFHMWTPDVYQGAPTSITAFLAAGSKAMGLAIFIQIFVIGLYLANVEWVLIVGFISVITMTLGNVVALWQQNVKRMLAYSSIAHAGYAMIGLAALSPLGIASALFHILTHALMKAGAFGVVAFTAIKGLGENVDDYNGLWKRAPILALAMTIFMFSLAGFPPLGGFWSKYWLFTSAVGSGLWLLALIGVINSVISVFYYARVIRAIYVEEPPKAFRVGQPAALTLAVVICLIGVIVIGIYPQPFIEALLNAVSLILP